MATPPTVCVLAAGAGTRMGRHGWLHKALLPLGSQAILSRILDAFPRNSHFVIAVHHQADRIRDYVAVAHPGLDVEWVEIDRIDGPGAGPGYSLLSCRPWLRRPFFLVCGDTLWRDAYSQDWRDDDWIGVGRAAESAAESASYCNLRWDTEGSLEIRDKRLAMGDGWRPFIGLAHVRSHEDFFAALARARTDGELQIAAGFEGFRAHGGRLRTLDWIDTGTEARYEAALRRWECETLPKEDEALYFQDGRVIKFFADARIARARVARARLFSGEVPEILAQRGGFYAYGYVPGRTLANTESSAVWCEFLRWMEHRFWSQDPGLDPYRLAAALRSAYVEKTEARLARFAQREPERLEDAARARGLTSLALREEILTAARALVQGARSGLVHGDLQPDNVVVAEAGGFRLLDWRQDFGGESRGGDVAWDLAKFEAWLRVDPPRLRARGGASPGAEAVVPCPHARASEFLALVRSHAPDPERVSRLAGLALVHMAALHPAPLGGAFFDLGVERLLGVGNASAARRAA